MKYKKIEKLINSSLQEDREIGLLLFWQKGRFLTLLEFLTGVLILPLIPAYLFDLIFSLGTQYKWGKLPVKLCNLKKLIIISKTWEATPSWYYDTKGDVFFVGIFRWKGYHLIPTPLAWVRFHFLRKKHERKVKKINKVSKH